MSNNEKHHLGVPVPDDTFQSINLYSLAKDIPKTQILRDSLACWVQKENLDMESLVKEMTIQVQNDWLRKKSRTPAVAREPDFQEHVAFWRRELERKKVSTTLINRILKQVNS